VSRRRWGLLLVWGLLFATGVWYAIQRVQFQTELSSLLPEGTTTTQRLLLSELRSGTTLRMILIGIEGDEAERMAEASKRLAVWMRDSGAYHLVANGTEAWSPEERELLFQHRYLLSPALTPDSFTPEHLRESLERLLDELSSPLAPMIKGLAAADPTGEFLALMQTWTPDSGPAKQHGVWFSPDLHRAVLMAETQAAGYDFDAQQRLQHELRHAFKQIAGDLRDPSLRLLMSGPAVFAVEVQEAIQNEAWWLSLLAGATVITFLYLTYRSATILALSLIPLTSGIVAGIVAVNLGLGSVHGITVAFGVTLLGVVDDYPIHLFSHMNGVRPARAVMREIWPTMGLGVLTTALGFSAMLLSGFPGLAQLGTFAVAGLLAAAAATRWVLPGLVPEGFQPRRSGARLPGWFDRAARAWPLVPLIVAVAAGSLSWSGTPLWEQDVDNLNPIPQAEKDLDRSLRQDLGAADVRHLIVVRASTSEAALRHSEKVAQALDQLVKKGELGGYDLAARYLPSRETQLKRQAWLQDAETLRRNLATALADLPFKPGVFQPFLDAVGEARSQTPLGPGDLEGTILGLKPSTLLLERNGEWTALMPLRGVVDNERFPPLVQSWQDPAVFFLDLKEESNRMVNTYRDKALALLGWGGLTIAFVLGVGLRDPGTVLRVMLPLAGAIICVGALLHALGERLSLYHLASFLLVIGLGLDYALFFNHPHGSHEDRGRTLYGLVVCSATTILVFGVLACSNIPVLRAIGMTAAFGSLCSLLFAAMLARSGSREV
jgi:predicted exporter